MHRTNLSRICAAILCVAFVALLSGCSTPVGPLASADEAARTSTGAAQDSSTATSSAPVVPGSEPLHNSTYRVNGSEQVKVVTNRGAFTMELFPKSAPNTVATFLELADAKFYDKIKFHRVESGFVVQAGDPQTKDPGVDPQLYGTGNPGFRLKAEFNGNKHQRGTVAMARAQDPDSAGSQFYITLAPQPTLDNQYTVFGQVVSGMDVVDAIVVGDIIESMTIVRAP